MPEIGVIFDMDGVLVDSYAAHFESWRRLAEEIGRTMTEARFAATFGRTSRDIIRELFGIDDPAAARRCDDRKEALYREIIAADFPAMPGATALVRSLHAAGIRLAVGSSGPPENVALACDRLGIEPCLDAIVTGADVTRGKPDPQVFQLAAERLTLPPGSCIVIEDAPAGVEAARRAGMRCVALAGTTPADALAAADRVVHRLDEIDAAGLSALIRAPAG
ncbi:MAG: HAD family hydrolase [Phycisphaerae bacterium]